MEILKPCPFCGSDARLLGGGYSQDYEEVWCKNSECLAHARPSVWSNRIEATERPIIPLDTCWGCEGLESEIAEIIRVAKDNPRGLVEFLKLNFPKEWGLSKKEHRALLDAPAPAQPDERREAFEVWGESFGLLLVRDEDGDYMPGSPSAAWAAWKARAIAAEQVSDQPGDCRFEFTKPGVELLRRDTNGIWSGPALEEIKVQLLAGMLEREVVTLSGEDTQNAIQIIAKATKSSHCMSDGRSGFEDDAKAALTALLEHFELRRRS